MGKLGSRWRGKEEKQVGREGEVGTQMHAATKADCEFAASAAEASAAGNLR